MSATETTGRAAGKETFPSEVEHPAIANLTDTRHEKHDEHRLEC
jgi:hypothetical protein